MEWKKSFTCPSCEYDKIYVNLAELIIDSTKSEEREMGLEMQHTVYHEVKCPRVNCRCDLVIKGDIFEYPEGHISLDETTVGYLK